MSTLKVLKEYLVGAGGYLLNDDNNGKTVMLSGAWGSGKTHFWQNDIEPKLSEKLKKDNKACVYVSLYGKDNIEVIKSEILQKAYSEIKEENIKQTKAISAFGMGTKILAGISIFGVKVDAQSISDETKNHYDENKIREATEFLSDGGLICFDDFERKSKKIDLNDLFGFISQLAIDMNCKVVIILNSDVFEGEEANVFKTVKEKTVNKFFYFEPTSEELFKSIFYTKTKEKRYKYRCLRKYKTGILNAIKETEELNARIYIQVLDNCLEWIDKDCQVTDNILRALVFNTVCFSKHHFLLEQLKRLPHDTKNSYPLYKMINEYPNLIFDSFESISRESSIKDIPLNQVLYALRAWITQKDSETKFKYNESVHDKYLLWIDEKEDELKAIYKYGYELYNFKSIDRYIEDKLMLFVKTGILLKKVRINKS